MQENALLRKNVRRLTTELRERLAPTQMLRGRLDEQRLLLNGRRQRQGVKK